MKTTRILLALAWLTMVPGLRAQSDKGTPITALPAVITQQGTYYLDRDLATAQTSGYAIDIQATNVTLDLNGHKLGGSAAGLGTTAVGIHAFRCADSITASISLTSVPTPPRGRM
jgi:hypothetical protein